MEDLAGLVVLGGNPQRLGLHAQVDVLGDQYHLAVAAGSAEHVGQGEDAVVRLGAGESLAHQRRLGLADLDEQAAVVVAQGEAFGQETRPRQAVELADELPRLGVDRVVAALEGVEFLEDDDGDGHVVLGEVVDAGVIVENHVGVEDEQLLR